MMLAVSSMECLPLLTPVYMALKETAQETIPEHIYMKLDCTKLQHIKKEITFNRHCAIYMPEVLKYIQTLTTLWYISDARDDAWNHTTLVSGF